MAQFTLFNCLSEDLLAGKHIVGTDTFKILLTNTAPLVTNTVKANLTEITPGDGYSAGGPTATVAKSRTAGVTKLTITDVVVTSGASGLGPFRYATVYNATTSGNPLVGFIDCGEAITMVDTDTVTLDFNGSTGVATVSVT